MAKIVVITRDQAARFEAAWEVCDYSAIHEIGEEVIEEQQLGQGIYQFVDLTGKVIRECVVVGGYPPDPKPGRKLAA
jgi:hypothetical protein